MVSPSPKAARDAGRLFNPHGRRHYRRRYSLGEVRAGLVVLCGLGALAAWVVWMGAHPDPALFANTELLDPGAPVADRGVLPEGLAAEGFQEGPISHFDADNLYVKIDGRADYFISKGFVRLSFVSLSQTADPAVAVDVELYDLGSADNALGAYAGEKSADLEPERGKAGLWHRDRNALYMTHGGYYVRAIGSDEGSAVAAQLAHLRQVLEGGIEVEGGAELPWAHRLFGALELSPGRVTFHRENAFSFGFARNVYSALLPDDETELFVTAASGEDAAAALAARFVEGFESYGERLEGDWVKDRYLGSLATARVAKGLVIGVRGAPAREPAEDELSRLTASVEAMTAADLEEATASAAPEEGLAKPGDGPKDYGGGKPPAPAEDIDEGGHE